MNDPRSGCRYTPFFCEENVWWLAHGRSRHRTPGDRCWVCLFTNDTASIVLMNQRLAAPGAPMAWDYHVVFAAPQAGAPMIFDLDSRLPFPSPWPDYFAGTFPDQASLPTRWCASVRQVPAGAYLDRFCSDRQHMVGLLPLSAFPPCPPICPKDAAAAITLGAYRDLHRRLDDGSLVAPVDRARAGPLSPTGH